MKSPTDVFFFQWLCLILYLYKQFLRDWVKIDPYHTHSFCHNKGNNTFNFPIVNCPAAPACGVYISQLIRYSRACGYYQDFLDRGLLLTRKLLNQGFLLVKLKSSLRKFNSLHHDLVDRYGISALQMTTDMFHLS